MPINKAHVLHTFVLFFSSGDISGPFCALGPIWSECLAGLGSPSTDGVFFLGSLSFYLSTPFSGALGNEVLEVS